MTCTAHGSGLLHACYRFLRSGQSPYALLSVCYAFPKRDNDKPVTQSGNRSPKRVGLRAACCRCPAAAAQHALGPPGGVARKHARRSVALPASRSSGLAGSGVLVRAGPCTSAGSQPWKPSVLFRLRSSVLTASSRSRDHRHPRGSDSYRRRHRQAAAAAACKLGRSSPSP